MSIVSEAYDILFLFFAHMGSIDLLIDKQELTKNKVLKAKGLCGSTNYGREKPGGEKGSRAFSASAARLQTRRGKA